MTTDKLPDTTVMLPIPWHWGDTDMVKQLQIEINDDHVLANKVVKTIARRQDNDDVLFEIVNDEYKYAVVHLTWSQHTEISRDYPRTKLYKTWQDLYDNRIMVDHVDFED
jgi:hypothetical protein